MEDAMVKVSELVDELGSHLGSVMCRNPYLVGEEQSVSAGDSYPWFGWQGGAGPDAERAIVTLDSARWGCYDNSGTYQRANFIALSEDYPEMFLTVGSSSHDGQALALPLAAEIPECLADVLRDLATNYPIYDDDALARVEMQIEQEAWDLWVEYDLRNEMESVAEVWGLTSWKILSEYIDSLPASSLMGVFREVLDELNIDPVFESADSCYYPKLEEIALAMAYTLHASYVAMQKLDAR